MRPGAGRKRKPSPRWRLINWAHDQVPAIEAHIQAQRYHQAFDLLQQVEAILPEDPRLAGLRTECSWELTIHTDPPGATVSRKPPDDSDGELGAFGGHADREPACGPRALSLED